MVRKTKQHLCNLESMIRKQCTNQRLFEFQVKFVHQSFRFYRFVQFYNTRWRFCLLENFKCVSTQISHTIKFKILRPDSQIPTKVINCVTCFWQPCSGIFMLLWWKFLFAFSCDLVCIFCLHHNYTKSISLLSDDLL